MNIETREIRDEAGLTAEERATGSWIKLPKGYKPKVPVSDEDYRRILAAEERRLIKNAKRLRALRASSKGEEKP